MGAVDFSKRDIEGFIDGVYQLRGKLQREREEAERVSSFVDSEVNRLLEKAEKCRSDMYSDYDFAGMVYRKNCSKIDSLRSEMSSLGTGEDTTGRREEIKREIGEIDSINRELSALQSSLNSKINSIESAKNSLSNSRDKVREAERRLHRLCVDAEGKLSEIEKKAKTAAGYADQIEKKLSFGDSCRDGRICFSNTSTVKRFSEQTSEISALMTENGKQLTRAAVTMKDSLKAEVSTTAVRVSEELIHSNGVMHAYLDKISASFAEVARLLTAYENL